MSLLSWRWHFFKRKIIIFFIFSELVKENGDIDATKVGAYARSQSPITFTINAICVSFHILFYDVFHVLCSKTENDHLISFGCSRHLAKGGVKAVFVNGTTGEGVQVWQFKTALRSSLDISTQMLRRCWTQDFLQHWSVKLILWFL